MNLVAKEDAMRALDIVLGKFPVNKIPALVLYDSRASHSFILKRFISKHNFSTLTWENSMTIKSRGVQQTTEEYCENVTIEVKDLVFWVNLIVIERNTVDIILGMD